MASEPFHRFSISLRLACRQEGRYYVSMALITRSRSEHPKRRRIPAGDIEGLVLDRLRALFASGAEVSDAVAPLGLDAATQRAVLDRAAKLAERWAKLASLELRERVRSVVPADPDWRGPNLGAAQSNRNRV